MERGREGLTVCALLDLINTLRVPFYLACAGLIVYAIHRNRA